MHNSTVMEAHRICLAVLVARSLSREMVGLDLEVKVNETAHTFGSGGGGACVASPISVGHPVSTFSGDGSRFGQTSLENLVQIILVMVEVELLVQASVTSVARAVMADME